jgi:flagellar biosynthesis protein FlhF
MPALKKHSLIQELLEANSNEGEGEQKRSSFTKAMGNLKRCLSSHHLSSEQQKEILERCMKEEGVSDAKNMEEILRRLMSFDPLIQKTDQGPIILVGTPGSGKTITAAKLACEALLQKRDVSLNTLDYVKAGGVAQIEKYASALNLKVNVFQNSTELSQFCRNAAPSSIQIIDTPGLNPLHKESFKMLVEVVIALKTPPTLILPAGLDAFDVRDQLKLFRSLGMRDLIWTKLDCTRFYGGLLVGLMCQGFNLAYLSSGPELGKRLLTPSSSKLASIIQEAPISKDQASSDKKKPQLLP